MRIGQTSFVVFVSQLVGSALGFIATIYFARVLGAEILGYYFLVVALVAWLKLGGHLGLAQAVTKRISEGEDASAFYTAGFFTISTLGISLSVLILLFRNEIDAYVGADVSTYIVIMLLAGLLAAIGQSTLKGEHRVHLAGILEPVNIGVTSIVQFVLVVGGFGLVGMLTGWVVGSTVIGLIGLAALSVGFERPRRKHFESLVDYAKFSWLGNLQSRAYQDVDLLVLGALVPATLVGVYAAAWSIAHFLILFGNAVSNTMFPEISRANEAGSDATVAGFVNDSLAFGGLIIIPGLVGGTILAERILRIYGPEFTRGTAVFSILVLAVTFYTYHQQLMNALNAIDRPDIAFRINAVFIVANVTLNVVLVLAFGFVGAAVATAISACIGLVLAFGALRQLVEFTLPFGEIGRQIVAALLMGAVVYAGHTFFEITGLVNHNAGITVFLVSIGGGVYFLALIGLSARFRGTIVANSPLDIPL